MTKKERKVFMKKFIKATAMGLAAMATVSVMNVSVFAENTTIDSNVKINNGIEQMSSSIVLSNRTFNTNLDATGTMVYNSDTKPVTEQFLKVWVNNQCDNCGSVYIVQTDAFDHETGKSTLVIASIIPNTDNQINNIDMISGFGGDYAKYRYKVRIEGTNNEAVCGRVALRQGVDLSALAVEDKLY